MDLCEPAQAVPKHSTWVQGWGEVGKQYRVYRLGMTASRTGMLVDDKRASRGMELLSSTAQHLGAGLGKGWDISAGCAALA